MPDLNWNEPEMLIEWLNVIFDSVVCIPPSHLSRKKKKKKKKDEKYEDRKRLKFCSLGSWLSRSEIRRVCLHNQARKYLLCQST